MNLEKVYTLLTWGKNVCHQAIGGMKDEQGRNILHLAVHLGEVELIRRICSDEPELIEGRDSYGDTPVGYAFALDDKRILDVFNAMPNIMSSDQPEATWQHILEYQWGKLMAPLEDLDDSGSAVNGQVDTMEISRLHDTNSIHSLKNSDGENIFDLLNKKPKRDLIPLLESLRLDDLLPECKSPLVQWVALFDAIKKSGDESLRTNIIRDLRSDLGTNLSLRLAIKYELTECIHQLLSKLDADPYFFPYDLARMNGSSDAMEAYINGIVDSKRENLIVRQTPIAIRNGQKIDIDYLFTYLKESSITTLDLIDSEMPTSLSGLQDSNVKHLILNNQYTSMTHIESLAQCLEASNLETLTLKGLPRQAVLRIAKSLENSSLNKLKLENCLENSGIPEDRFIKELIHGVSKSNIKKLDLLMQPFNFSNTSLLLEMLWATKIDSLKLFVTLTGRMRSPKFSSKEISAIVRKLEGSSLKEVCFYGETGNMAARTLARSIKRTSIISFRTRMIDNFSLNDFEEQIIQAAVQENRQRVLGTPLMLVNQSFKTGDEKLSLRNRKIPKTRKEQFRWGLEILTNINKDIGAKILSHAYPLTPSEDHQTYLNYYNNAQNVIDARAAVSEHTQNNLDPHVSAGKRELNDAELAEVSQEPARYA